MRRCLGISIPACFIRPPHKLDAFKKAMSGESMPESLSSEQRTFSEKRNQQEVKEDYDLGIRVKKDLNKPET